MLLFYMESQVLLWQVDQIYDFAPSLLNPKGEHKVTRYFVWKNSVVYFETKSLKFFRFLTEEFTYFTSQANTFNLFWFKLVDN